jgi:predicted HAD superfamily Cof-like phosphohydrolase
MVEEFHAKFGQTIGTEPGFRDKSLRWQLIAEECGEFYHATLPAPLDAEPNFPEACDAVIDLIYVLLGTLVAWGVDAEPLFRAVHAANMAKTGGKDANGKVTKGPGWTAPDVLGLLKQQGYKP